MEASDGYCEAAEQGQEGDARTQARHIEERVRSEGKEPQAGHRHRDVGVRPVQVAKKDWLTREDSVANEYRPGEIVPQSGIYKITHDRDHPDMPHEVTAVKGRRFPTCRHCKGVSFMLVHAAQHIEEIPALHSGSASSA
jgi:hypothetical protein